MVIVVIFLGVFVALLGMLGLSDPKRLIRFVEWRARRPAAFVRVWALVACVFGLFLVDAGL